MRSKLLEFLKEYIICFKIIKEENLMKMKEKHLLQYLSWQILLLSLTTMVFATSTLITDFWSFFQIIWGIWLTHTKIDIVYHFQNRTSLLQHNIVHEINNT